MIGFQIVEDVIFSPPQAGRNTVQVQFLRVIVYAMKAQTSA